MKTIRDLTKTHCTPSKTGDIASGAVEVLRKQQDGFSYFKP